MRVVSYNVLADGYVRRSYYPLTPPELLEPGRRRAALVRHILALGADILCLQEVEPATLAALGGAPLVAQKRGKPDAVATLVGRPVAAHAVLEYPDATGHVALLVAVEDGGGLIGVANTHVKWDPPGAAVGVAQVERLCDAVDGFAPACDGWILAGDFNAGPDSALHAAVRARGYRDPFPDAACTCNSSQVPKRIDFLFHSPSLVAVAAPLPPLAPDTPLPSATEPSDHLAIAAELTRRG
jgi:endonuclease/exonuclease/phosphatase family metal-dependent hydrolase